MKTKLYRITVTVPVEEFMDIEQAARERCMSNGQFIRLMIRNALKKSSKGVPHV